MRQVVFTIFLFLYSSNIGYSQNQCRCDAYKKQFLELESFIEKKDYESFDSQIKIIKTTEANCQQQKWSFLIEVFVLKNDISSADSVSNLFLNSITKNTCESILALYNYQKGNLELKKNSFENATMYLMKANEQAIAIKDTLLRLKAMARLAISFSKIRQPKKAIEYDRMGIKLLSTYKNDRQLLQYMCNRVAHFGICYDVELDRKYLDSVKTYIPASIVLARKLNAKTRIAQSFSMLAGVLYADKDFQKSLSFCDSSLNYLNPKIDFKQLGAIYQKKCDNYIELKKYDLAMQFANMYLEMTKKEGDILLLATSYERLYEVSKLIGKTDIALSYYERTVKIRDSIRTQEVTETVNDIEQKYHKSENEKEINKLNYDKETLNQKAEIDKLQIRSLIGIVTAIILLLVIILFFYRQSVIKNQLKTIEIEQRLNRSRMNPHFFFNALASLQSITLKGKKHEEIAEYIHRFSKIMRESLESSYIEMNTLEKEIDFLTHYLELQKLRSANKFEYFFDLDDELDITELLIPSMILQPFIENSIEHGFSDIKEGGVVNIKFNIINSYLNIIIADNGGGLREKEGNKDYPSRATQIIHDRLLLLNKQHKSKANYTIINQPNGVGMEISINLPIIYKV